MNQKTARLVRQIHRRQCESAVALGHPTPERRKKAIRRALASLDHRDRGARQGKWRAIVSESRKEVP